MGVKERMIEFIEFLQIGQKKFADKVGLSNGFVNNIGPSITTTSLNKIAKAYPNLNINWLLTGKGHMMNITDIFLGDGEKVNHSKSKDLLHAAEESAKYKSARRAKFKETSDTRRPIYNISGTASPMVIFNDEPELIEGYVDVPEFGQIAGYVRVYGNSMYPKYCNGDVVACRELTNKRIIPYGEAYLVITDEHRMIKYIDSYDHDEKKVTLRSEHADYKPFVIERDDIKKLYIIKGKITRNII